MLTGPAVAIDGLSDQLAAELGIPVVPAVVAQATAGTFSQLDAGRLTVAAGLAVEERHS
jgi:Tfp pilus assembly PilM family ATPase